MDSESVRYINYLYKSLVSNDEHVRKVLTKSKNMPSGEEITEKIVRLGFDEPSPGLSLRLEKAYLAAKSSDLPDTWNSKAIFEPLLEQLLETGEKMGLNLERPVIRVDSPSEYVTPYAFPTTGDHILFAGAGTLSFCNYWAKYFSSILSELEGDQVGEDLYASVRGVLTKQRTKFDEIFRVIAAYATKRSTIGAGSMTLSYGNLGSTIVRTELVTAMEAFVLGHEIGHFLQLESDAESASSHTDFSVQSEIECDDVGLLLSSVWGIDHENVFAGQCVAPVFYFYAFNICEVARSLITGEKLEKSLSHPSLGERLDNIRSFATRISQEHLAVSLDHADVVCNAVQDHIVNRIRFRLGLVEE